MARKKKRSKKKGRGWHGEPVRHGLAAQGITTVIPGAYTDRGQMGYKKVGVVNPFKKEVLLMVDDDIDALVKGLAKCELRELEDKAPKQPKLVFPPSRLVTPPSPVSEERVERVRARAALEKERIGERAKVREARIAGRAEVQKTQIEERATVRVALGDPTTVKEKLRLEGIKREQRAIELGLREEKAKRLSAPEKEELRRLRDKLEVIGLKPGKVTIGFDRPMTEKELRDTERLLPGLMEVDALLVAGKPEEAKELLDKQLDEELGKEKKLREAEQ